MKTWTHVLKQQQNKSYLIVDLSPQILFMGTKLFFGPP